MKISELLFLYFTLKLKFLAIKIICSSKNISKLATPLIFDCKNFTFLKSKLTRINLNKKSSIFQFVKEAEFYYLTNLTKFLLLKLQIDNFLILEKVLMKGSFNYEKDFRI
jgi:hypothetical protein